PGRVLVLTALHCRAAAPGTGGSWFAAGCASISRWNAKIRPTHHARSGRLGADVGARRAPLQARRLHVSSHMGPYTHYPPAPTILRHATVRSVIISTNTYSRRSTGTPRTRA